MTYKLIYADPPWNFKVRSEKGKGRSPKYRTTDVSELAKLDIQSIADKDSALAMWVTDPMIPQGLELMKAWGFTFKTVLFYWVKLNKSEQDYFMGTGYYTRANPEQCWIGTMGKGLKRINAAIPRLLVKSVEEHSKKPHSIRLRLEALYGNIPRVELFAREKPKGWDAWGDEVESDLVIPMRS